MQILTLQQPIDMMCMTGMNKSLLISFWLHSGASPDQNSSVNLFVFVLLGVSPRFEVFPFCPSTVQKAGLPGFESQEVETWQIGRVGNEACIDRSAHWLWRDRRKSGGRWEIFTHLHCSLCILVSNLEIGGQIIHQSIRLDERNVLIFMSKFYVQRFGRKFKKWVFPEMSAST